MSDAPAINAHQLTSTLFDITILGTRARTSLLRRDSHALQLFRAGIEVKADFVGHLATDAVVRP